MALQKLSGFVLAMEQGAKTNRRAEQCAILLGLARTQLYNRHVADAFLETLRRVLGKREGAQSLNSEELNLRTVNEIFGLGENMVVIRDSDGIAALIGRFSDGVLVENQQTWKPGAVLSRMVHLDDIAVLVKAVRQAEKRRGRNALGTDTITGMDLDEFSWLVLEMLLAAVERHRDNLVEAFAKFDSDNSSGLSFPEFEALLGWCAGGASRQLTMAEKLQLFETIESKADGNDDEDENDDVNDPLAFAHVVMNSVSCALSFPRSCRNYWRAAND